uniref:vomeronasal type-1 receptor 4-like n=1 Tax=Jaculus jaculus TaxID=51337 RepID=UPI000332FC10|nr:vomeronasal type-1 receptor 4-like [Jaculus jaculus]
MIPENLVMAIFFFSQTAVGILVNWLLLLHYCFYSVFTGQNLMPKDLIVNHLTFANFLTIISRGIPQTMAEFGLKYFLNDLVCKLVVYVYRVSRGISLYTTCLLSCFQVLTISRGNTRWVRLKHRASKYIRLSCSLSWLVHLLLNVMIPMRVTSSANSRNGTKRFTFGYCSGFVSGTVATPLYMSILCITDVLCLGLMAWASGSMVSLLYRHKRQVQYLRGAQHSSQLSPETRATQTILILVCTYAAFYSMSSILVLYTAFFSNPKLWLINTFILLETCFPTVSPFVLFSNNNSAAKLYFPYWGKR